MWWRTGDEIRPESIVDLTAEDAVTLNQRGRWHLEMVRAVRAADADGVVATLPSGEVQVFDRRPESLWSATEVAYTVHLLIRKV